MILAKETIGRRIEAGQALLASAKKCNDEEIGLGLQSFQNILDTLGDYVKLQTETKRLTDSILTLQKEVAFFDRSTSQEASGMWAVVLKERDKNRRLQEIIETKDITIKDLAMLIRRICSNSTSLVNRSLRGRALDYLRRKNLDGSPLRTPLKE